MLFHWFRLLHINVYSYFQGVQLANIVKNMKISEDNEKVIHEIVESLKLIDSYDSNEQDISIISNAVKSFTKECEISLGHRVLANDNNAYTILIGFLKKVQVSYLITVMNTLNEILILLLNLKYTWNKLKSSKYLKKTCKLVYFLIAYLIFTTF